MKGFIKILVLMTILVAGFLFVMKYQNGQNGESPTRDRADSSVLSTENQGRSNDHIRTATKKRTLDKTDTRKVDINIDDYFFDPTVLKIKNGTSVNWKNNGGVSHTVTTASGSPRQGPGSGLIGPSETYSFTFDEPGLYLYVCSQHSAQMRGVIEVVE